MKNINDSTKSEHVRWKSAIQSDPLGRLIKENEHLAQHNEVLREACKAAEQDLASALSLLPPRFSNQENVQACRVLLATLRAAIDQTTPVKEQAVGSTALESLASKVQEIKQRAYAVHNGPWLGDSDIAFLFSEIEKLIALAFDAQSFISKYYYRII